MTIPDQNGAFEPYNREELARLGHAYAAIKIRQCDDGLFRYALDVMYSYGGFSGPVPKEGEGFHTHKEAIETATQQLLNRFPTYHAGEPQSVDDELRLLRAQVESRFRQPSLF